MHIRNSNDGQLSQLKNVLNLYNLGILLKTQIRGLWFSNMYYVHINWIIITDSVHIAKYKGLKENSYSQKTNSNLNPGQFIH